MSNRAHRPSHASIDGLRMTAHHSESTHPSPVNNPSRAVNKLFIKTLKKNLQNVLILTTLESSGTTYFNSLTGTTESESGKSQEALKITGTPELHKTKTATAAETAM